MNGGRIEQQGSPREIFNHPRTEFTAKFIGGHNVIAIGDETLAVREDRLQLRRPGEAVNGPSMAGTVSEVEYQGTYIRVAIVADGGADISAQLTDIQFDRDQLRRRRARSRHLGPGAGKPTEDKQFCNRPVA